MVRNIARIYSSAAHSMFQLKHDAQVTLETLSDNYSSAAISDPFDEVFLTDKRTFYRGSTS